MYNVMTAENNAVKIKNVDIRKSTMQDIVYLKTRLRKHDIDEIWASSHLKPVEALTYSFYLSTICLTVIQGEPVGMFGLVEDPADENRAIIWMLGSERLNKVSREVIRDTKYIIDGFLDNYDVLFNHVDARNTKAIRWLRYLGADINDAEPFGKEGLLFHRFTFRRMIIHV